MTEINETVVNDNRQGSSSLNDSVAQSEKDLTYENMENELVQEILSALESSSAVAEAVQRGQEVCDKKARLKSELNELRNKKADLIKSIKDLKKDFGAVITK